MTSVSRLDPSAENGLSQAQAKERQDAGLSNVSSVSGGRSAAEIIKDNLFTFFNLIFAVLAVLLIIAGSYKSLTFLPVVIANIVIGTVQELRAKKTLDQLSLLNEPKARAVRGGEVIDLPAEQLVLDDIAVFGQGSQICADAVVKSGEVSVNESLLTGETAEIKKLPGDELLSGSFVVSGECRARLDKVGDDCYAAKLTAMAKATEHKERSEMMRVLNRIVGAVGIIIIPVGIALFCQQYFGAGRDFSGSIVSMVAAAIGMIPEGLYFLTSIALAVSTVRLAQRRVMLHEMKSIETLARVDVLCLDKTGTITDSGMTVNGVVDLRGRLPGDGEHLSREALEGLIGTFVGAMPKGNITDDALKARFAEKQAASGLETPGAADAEDSGPLVTDIQPFSSVYKYASAVIGGYRYLLGAPEMVLGDGFERVRDDVEKYNAQGFRTLLLARVDADRPAEMAAGKTAEELALITLENRVRETAPQTFAYFKEQGVDIKIISGDSPLTVSRVAAQAGVEGAEKYVDARELTTPELIAEAAEKYTVFGRVLPEQKRELILALKKAGHTVGMTGDGINDILALKEADCSVAMASGCDAAMQVSQVVLLDSDFSAMPGVVGEGRRVVGQSVPCQEHFLAAYGAAFDNLLRALSHAAYTGYTGGRIYDRHTGFLPGACSVQGQDKRKLPVQRSEDRGPGRNNGLHCGVRLFRVCRVQRTSGGGGLHGLHGAALLDRLPDAAYNQQTAKHLARRPDDRLRRRRDTCRNAVFLAVLDLAHVRRMRQTHARVHVRVHGPADSSY